MKNVSSEMKSLCEDIVTAHEDRKRDIKALREESETIRDNARRFARDCKKLHEEMAKDLRKSLAKDREELIKNVSFLREDFRKKEKEIRSDLAEASSIWGNMHKTLKTKKKGKVK